MVVNYSRKRLHQQDILNPYVSHLVFYAGFRLSLQKSIQREEWVQHHHFRYFLSAVRI